MDELMEIARGAAVDAGHRLLDRFGEPPAGVGTKSTATDLVSDADREAEEGILRRIRAARPEDGILAEEGGSEPGESGYRWIIDPLDGTVNFLFRIPQWCVSIAVEDDEGVLVAVVHDACRGETFTAGRGEGAFLNDEPIRVSDADDPATALVATGFAYAAETRAMQAELVGRVLPRVRDIRRLGSAALDLAWTAAGRYDAFYEWGLGRWDEAAGRLLVTEAGGVVSDLEAPEDVGDGVLAAGPGVHDAIRALVVG